ncbi:MAG: beta tubulin [Methylocystis sp.]|nr:MAG: beta tubulin [Methylocystis sp.]
MLDVSPSLKAKLDGRATTFCHCWRLARRDGFVSGFTDHDRDLAFNGVTFRANTGLSASQLETGLGFAPGTGEASGALADESLTEADLLNGLYDGASVETWLVDWSHVEDRALLDVATIGEMRRGENAFSAELRSAAHAFDQQQGRSFQRGCSADLGDARCGVDLQETRYRTGAAIVSCSGGVLTLDLASHFESGFFTGGALIFTGGANADARLTIKSHRQEGLRATLALWTPLAGDILPGEPATLTAGCDKSPGACQKKFGNIVNFRGFPHMPGNDRVIAYPSSLAPAMDGGSFFR